MRENPRNNRPLHWLRLFRFILRECRREETRELEIELFFGFHLLTDVSFSSHADIQHTPHIRLSLFQVFCDARVTQIVWTKNSEQSNNQILAKNEKKNSVFCKIC